MRGAWIALMVIGAGGAARPDLAGAQAANRPDVLIVTTGGTIASRQGAPTLEGPVLVQAVPALLDHADVTVEEFSRIGSSQMTPDHWLRLAQLINTRFRERPDLAGVVVTHGTDTMEETAFFLHLTVRDDRPVVLVGSMRSANQVSADGPANLLAGVRVAAGPSARGHGVLLVLNDEINSARDAWKTDNQRVQTFRAPEQGLLGVADPDTVLFFRRILRPHTAATEFDVTGLATLPDVPIVSDYVGFDGSTIGEWANKGADGIVVVSFAGGRMSAGAREATIGAANRGLPVVIASRVPGGRIPGEGPDERLLLARDLSPHQARILLMLGLTVTRERGALQGIFARY